MSILENTNRKVPMYYLIGNLISEIRFSEQNQELCFLLSDGSLFVFVAMFCSPFYIEFVYGDERKIPNIIGNPVWGVEQNVLESDEALIPITRAFYEVTTNSGEVVKIIAYGSEVQGVLIDSDTVEKCMKNMDQFSADNSSIDMQFVGDYMKTLRLVGLFRREVNVSEEMIDAFFLAIEMMGGKNSVPIEAQKTAND